MTDSSPKPDARPIPVTLITGFLGSGKTTLLSHLLAQTEAVPTAVLVNEFGEIGLDHDLIRRGDDQVIELSNGCICCAMQEDLVETLGDLMARRGQGDIAAFRRVAMETSGLADPAPIVQTLLTYPYLAEIFRLDAVITTVDAVNGGATLDKHPEAVKQAALADRLILTKTDLVDDDMADALTARLQRLNAGARRLTVVNGAVGPEALFDIGVHDPDVAGGRVQDWLGETGQHAHHHHEHSVDIETFCVVRDRPVAPAAFADFLRRMSAECGPDLLRIKGLVNVAGYPDRPAVIHGVQQAFHPPVWLDRWPSADRRTRIVAITRGAVKDWITEALDAVDGPVAQAAP